MFIFSFALPQLTASSVNFAPRSLANVVGNAIKVRAFEKALNAVV